MVVWILFDPEGDELVKFFCRQVCLLHIYHIYKVGQDILDISDKVHEYWMDYIDTLSSYQVKLTSNFTITSGISHRFE